jgi:hypothetical protein
MCRPSRGAARPNAAKGARKTNEMVLLNFMVTMVDVLVLNQVLNVS